MNKLILHHFYSQSAFDLSNNRNHGFPTAIAQSSAPNAPSFNFLQQNSEVLVPTNETLENLWSVRAVVTFNLSVNLPITKRYNLMEGHISFALFIENDGSLAGTIVDKNGHWTGANSSPNLVKPNQWHIAELQHDGVNTLRLLLDGVEVAAAYNVVGMVKSVGPHGLAIGHWPEAAGTYTFVGFIRETFLYKYDPAKDVNSILDNCCMDRKAIQDTVNALKEKGETADSVKAKAMEILQFATDVQVEVRGNSKEATLQQQQLNQQAMAAFVSGNQARYTETMAQLALLAQENLSTKQQKDIHAREDKIVSNLPLPLKDFQKLIKDMCLNKVKLNPKQFETALNHLKEINVKKSK